METTQTTNRQLPPIQEWQDEMRPQLLIAIERYKTRLAMNTQTRENLNKLRAQKWEPMYMQAIEEVQIAEGKTLDTVDAWMRAEICKYQNLLTATDYKQVSQLLGNTDTSNSEMLTLMETIKQGSEENAAAFAKIKTQETQETINAETHKKCHDIWDQTSKACMVCNTMQNTKACSRCRKAFYCCIEHQRFHWQTHKRWCVA
jgi:uncharacterized membrane protein YgaE (UPF0421/DUF939 family)